MLSKLREISAYGVHLLRLLWDSESFLPAEKLLVRSLFRLFYQDTAFPLPRLRTPSLPPVSDLALLAKTTTPHLSFPKGQKYVSFSCARGDKNFLLLQLAWGIKLQKSTSYSLKE